MPTTLPVEIYDLLERKVGKEDAREVGKVILASFDAIERRAETVVVQKKAEIKDELTKELVTKEDSAKLEGRLNESIAAFEVHLNEKISAVEVRLNEKIAAVEVRLSDKIAAVEVRLSDKIAAVDGRIAAVDGRITAVEGRLNERLTAMDWKMKIYFLILLSVMLLTNKDAVILIAKLVGLVK